MRKDKVERAMKAYDGFKGHHTVSHVMNTIPKNLCDELVGRQIGAVMNIRNVAYHEGAAAAIKEIEEYIGLPTGVSLWAVIGDQKYLGFKTFSDGLDIPDVLLHRGNQVKTWEEEE